MKRAFFSVCLLLSVVSIAQAHTQFSITLYVQFSKTVCVAKATEVKNSVITFTVEEIVKGQPPAVLTLHAGEGSGKIVQNTEWLLASRGTSENTVGWPMEGDYGWVNAPIQRIDGKIHLVGYHGYIDPTLAADPSKGLTLEQLKDLAKKPLPKN
ncbi:MAG: hypothetical protein LV481_13350 [Methylacidiphilales bacterium]|nr:hypothetical protein [Candidatus Methylacidiphilales bacterium]